MAIKCLSGRARAVRRAVSVWRFETLNTGSSGAMIVPAQLTLQAERDCLESTRLSGTFDMQVYSPDRLFAKIFSAAGEPKYARVDEQGRVMLCHMAALRLKDDLKWYQSAVGKPGFAGKLAAQITSFKQAGMTPADVEKLSQNADKSLEKKLCDMSVMYGEYERLLEGRFMDGEDVLREAVSRLGDAGFLSGCRVLVYGFDILTMTLINLIIALNGIAESVDVAIVTDDSPEKRDCIAFEPVNRSVDMLMALAAEGGVRVGYEKLSDITRDEGGIGFLENELCCLPPKKFFGTPNDVQMALLPNPEAEAEFAVSLIRRMCRTRGWRYRDFAIALMSDDEYSRDALNRAFNRAKTPLFLASGRPADRHSLSRALLCAMRSASRGYGLNDVVGYLRSGFSGLTDDECDLLVNYAVATNMRGKRWGREIDDEKLDGIRKRAIDPIMEMAENVAEAADTRGKLAAVFGFLEDIRAYETLEDMRKTLEKYSMPSWAAEGAQVWNRITQALDQMNDLLSGEKIDLALIYDCMSRSLGQANVKALPQSADAVEAGAVEHLRGKPVKALIIMGAVESPAGVSGSLLDEGDISRLGDAGRAFTLLSRRDVTRMQKLNLLSLLSLTEKYLLITRPLSDTAGRAMQAGSLMRTIGAIMPKVKLRGVDDAEKLAEMSFEQGELALSRIGQALSRKTPGAYAAKKALGAIDEYAKGLERVMSAADFKVYSEKLPKDLVKPAYGSLKSVSVSRLERYASCPFRHFANYALRPEEFRTYELSPRDAGVFYHAALEAFMRQNAQKLGDIGVDECRKSMDDITEELIDRAMFSAFEPGELEKAEARRMRDVARRAAEIAAKQFDGSRFRPVDIEADIEKGYAKVRLGDAELTGRIDRVDVFDDGEERYARVVDYKKGARRVSLPEIYAGLQLQLVLYLAAAVKQYKAIPAGMFYFSVADPLIDTELRDPDLIDIERRKLLRLDGLALNDPNVIKAMAESPELALKVAFNKDGTVKKTQNAITGDDFETIIKRSMEIAGDILNGILGGDTSISPAQTASGCACDWCDSKTICQIDPELPGGDPRVAEITKGSEVMAAVRNGSDG